MKCEAVLFVLAISGLVVSPTAMRGQGSPSPRLKFEAASVRRSAPGVDRYSARVSPSTMIYTGITLKLSARFDITAKLDKPHPPLEMLTMLQDLLEDRFGLVLAPERRVQSHYSLVQSASKDGKTPGLKKTPEDECAPRDAQFNQPSNPDAAIACGGVRITPGASQYQLVATSVPMSQFALILTGQANSWVENNTGLDGYYDITFSWTPDTIQSDDAGPTIFGALQNELGLKLQPVKGPVPMFVIQHAEMPTEN